MQVENTIGIGSGTFLEVVDVLGDEGRLLPSSERDVSGIGRGLDHQSSSPVVPLEYEFRRTVKAFDRCQLLGVVA